MHIFKVREFSKWAVRQGVTDKVLWEVVAEMERGLSGVKLGGHVFKKRVALRSRGKSSGMRTLLAYRAGSKAFFIYGFAKNVKADIKADELNALKAAAGILLGYEGKELSRAIKAGELIEVTGDEQ